MSWRDQATCKQVDPELFFPPETSNTTLPARRVCAGCPVREACLDYGLHEEHGVWGGTSPKQRRSIKRDRRV